MRRIGMVVCLLALALAGCGGGGRRTSAGRIPPDLARAWAQRADAISAAAATGDSCQASRLANTLQSEVSGQLNSIPLRYRKTLLSSVSRIANGLTCTVTVRTTAPPKPKPKPPKGPGPTHDHHGDHGHGHHGGDGGGHGGDGGDGG